MTDLLTMQRTKMFVNETFLTLYMTVNWHREFCDFSKSMP